MAATVIQQVRPASFRFESLALLLATVAAVGLIGGYLYVHGEAGGSEPLYDWQVSAFDTLAGADQAIYNALYTVKDEIPFIYDDINMMNAPGVKFRWPGLQDFQDQLLPPFFKDKSWVQNGSLQWSLHEPLAEGEMQGSTMYLGTAGKVPGQGSFLLVIGHVHAGFTNNNAIVIWWNAKNVVGMPESGFRDTLILQGWREVVPHSGAQEIRRIFGEKPAVPGREGPDAEQAGQDDAEQAVEAALGTAP
jgi:hypothetical protein